MYRQLVGVRNGLRRLVGSQNQQADERERKVATKLFKVAPWMDEVKSGQLSRSPSLIDAPGLVGVMCGAPCQCLVPWCIPAMSLFCPAQL